MQGRKLSRSRWEGVPWRVGWTIVASRRDYCGRWAKSWYTCHAKRLLTRFSVAVQRKNAHLPHYCHPPATFGSTTCYIRRVSCHEYLAICYNWQASHSVRRLICYIRRQAITIIWQPATLWRPISDTPLLAVIHNEWWGRLLCR